MSAEARPVKSSFHQKVLASRGDREQSGVQILVIIEAGLAGEIAVFGFFGNAAAFQKVEDAVVPKGIEVEVEQEGAGSGNTSEQFGRGDGAGPVPKPSPNRRRANGDAGQN